MPQTLGESQLCNLALYHLGENQIGDISDPVPEAQACNMYWVPARDDLFNEHEFGFSQSQIPLVLLPAPSGMTILAGWQYVYAYPVQVGGVWAVYNPCNWKKKEEIEFDKYYIQSQGILALGSNEPDAICDATSIVTDPTLWDPKFALAFSHKLAAYLAIALTGDEAVAQAQAAVALGMINECKRIGYNEKKKKPHQVHGYRDSRGGGYVGPQGEITLDNIFGPGGPPS